MEPLPHQEIKKVDWFQFDTLMKVLVNKIQKEGVSYDAVYGLPRGGLTPAVYLSHYLKIPLTDNFEAITENTLVVDDICDHGTTLASLEAAKGFKFESAVILRHSVASYWPTYVGLEVSGDAWYDFPWELPTIKA